MVSNGEAVATWRLVTEKESGKRENAWGIIDVFPSRHTGSHCYLLIGSFLTLAGFLSFETNERKVMEDDSPIFFSSSLVAANKCDLSRRMKVAWLAISTSDQPVIKGTTMSHIKISKRERRLEIKSYPATWLGLIEKYFQSHPAPFLILDQASAIISAMIWRRKEGDRGFEKKWTRYLLEWQATFFARKKALNSIVL